MLISLIVAMDEQGVIGRDNALPWHLPEDLRYFRRHTMGKPIVMGRKTWESIGRPLPGRTNVVVTRDASYEAAGGHVTTSLEAALTLARDVASIDGVNEVMVIGGAQLYRLALPIADRLYLTRVHTRVSGDATLELDLSQWHLESEERHEACDTNPYAYSFQQYNKKAN